MAPWKTDSGVLQTRNYSIKLLSLVKNLSSFQVRKGYFMNITVKLTGLLAGAAGFREKTMETSDGTSAWDLFTRLSLPVGEGWTRISINNRLANKKQLLYDGDTILFFPIGGGG